MINTPFKGFIFSYTISLFLYFLSFPVFCKAQTDVEGEWIGQINDGGITYAYSLTFNSGSNRSTGVSTSKNANFKCSASFQATIKSTSIIVKELAVLSSSLADRSQICLMTLKMEIQGDKLIGKFESRNKVNGKCGSGEVKLVRKNKLKEVTDEIVNRQAIGLDLSVAKKQSNPALENKIKIDNRQIRLSETIIVPFDSIHLDIYDNGMIDGDVVSVYVNQERKISQVKLTDKPVSIDLLKTKGKEFVIEFYAESLGSVPPNTGIMILKNGSYRREVSFSSDYTTTNMIKLILQ